MRYIHQLFCSLFLLVLSSCGQHEEIKYYPNGEVARRASLDSQGNFVGDVIHYYENGQVERITPFVNHRINGVVKSYYRDGRTYFIESWKNGKREGKATAYYPDGKIKYRASLLDTIRVDTAKWYYRNGQLRYWARYDKDGRKVDFSAYRANGEINSSHMYPLFLSGNDSINKGENYSFEIILGNRRTNAVSIKFIKPLVGIDSVEGIYTKTRYVMQKPDKGQHIIKAIMYQRWVHSDTVWTNWYNINHKFYVK